MVCLEAIVGKEPILDEPKEADLLSSQQPCCEGDAKGGAVSGTQCRRSEPGCREERLGAGRGRRGFHSSLTIDSGEKMASCLVPLLLRGPRGSQLTVPLVNIATCMSALVEARERRVDRGRGGSEWGGNEARLELR